MKFKLNNCCVFSDLNNRGPNTGSLAPGGGQRVKKNHLNEGREITNPYYSLLND